MDNTAGVIGAVDFTATLTGLLDAVTYDDVALLADRKQLDLVTDLLRAHARLTGVLHTVVGVVDRAEAAMTAHDVPMVTPDIRHALHVRDQGCVFPGCDRPAADCDAHHIQPWTNDGETALHNLCLLCKHHHNLLEPDRKRSPEL